MTRNSVLAVVVVAAGAVIVAAQQSSPLPAGALVFGVFTGQFRADGTFSIAG